MKILCTNVGHNLKQKEKKQERMMPYIEAQPTCIGRVKQ